MEEMNYTACAGNDVLLTCATTTPEVVWEIYNGAGILVDTYSANSTTNISAQQKGNVFTFEKTSENNSTVTFEAQYALNGYLVYCTDVDFMTNSSTNMTTTSNNTEYCPIKIPGNKV